MSLEPGLVSTLTRIYNSMKCQAIHKSTHTRAYMPQRINGGRVIPIFSTQVCCRFGTYNLWANVALFSSSLLFPARWWFPSIQLLPLFLLLAGDIILSVLCLLSTRVRYTIHRACAGFLFIFTHVVYYSPKSFAVN